MEHLKTLNHDEMVALEGGFVPVVILGVTYSAKTVAAYFGGVAIATSTITLNVINNIENSN